MFIRRWLLIAVSLTLVLNPLTPLPTAHAAGNTPPTTTMLLAQLEQAHGTPLQVSYHRLTGQVNFLSAPTAAAVWSAPAALTAAPAPQAAAAFLQTYGALFGLTNPAQELTVARTKTLPDGRAVVRYQQVYQGVPVLAGELMVQLDAHNAVLSVNGEAAPQLALDVRPTLAAAIAETQALAAVSTQYGLATETLVAEPAVLSIYQPALLGPTRGPDTLVWRVTVTAPAHPEIAELVLVDQRGEVALQFNQTFVAPPMLTPANAPNEPAGEQPELGLPATPTRPNVPLARFRITYSAENGTSLPGIFRCDENTACIITSSSYTTQLHAGDVYNFYSNVHDRDSLNGSGLPLTSTYNYDSPTSAGFWSPTLRQVVYDKDEDENWADDMVGYFFTFGVTQYESALYPYYQAGSIAVSFSDLWGEFIDQTNGRGSDDASDKWKIGEDATYLRYMKDPPSNPGGASNSGPDKMSSNKYDESDTNAGMFKNSGVNDKAVYLLVEGGSFNGQTIAPALGLTKTAQLYYEVQTNLLTSGSDYLDLANALVQACRNLSFPGDECQAVQAAINAVEMTEEPKTNYNSHARLCPGNLVVETVLFNGDPELGTTGWNMDPEWSRVRNFVHTGHWAFYGNDGMSNNDKLAALTQTTSVALPNLTGVFLHFHHAYGFEGPDKSGGVLRYSTNNGSTWNFMPTNWLEVNGYDNAIKGANNPYKDQWAFLDDSHGYISTRVNLSALANQSVRFSWVFAVDNPANADVPIHGWWLDDIQIYTCGLPKTYVPLVMRSAFFGNGLPITQDFESGQMPPTGWTYQSTTAAASWEASTSIPYQGNWSARVLYTDTQGVPQNEVLFSPSFTAAPSSITFATRGSTTYCVTTNACDLRVWLVRGNWDAGAGDDVLLRTVDDAWIPGAPTTWVPVTVPNANSLNGSSGRIAFQFIRLDLNATTANTYIDNVVISP